MDNWQKKKTQYSLVHLFYWMSHAVCTGFAAVYLQSLGYSNTSLGLVLACGNVSGFILSPYLAQLIDSKRGLDIYSCMWLLLVAQDLFLALFIMIPEKSLLISLLYCLYIACHNALNPMHTELYLELDRGAGVINYSVSRGIGCLGYSLCSFMLGDIVQKMGSGALSVAGLVILCFQASTLLIVCRRVGSEDSRSIRIQKNESSKLNSIDFIKSNPKFFRVITGQAFQYFALMLAHSFLINLIRNVGGNTSTLGILSGFTAGTELLAMLVYPVAAKKVSCSWLLGFSSVMYTVKAFVLAVSRSVGCLAVGLILNSLSYAVMTPALVQYTAQIVDDKDSAKGQALSFGSLCLGTAAASVAGGIMYDRLSVNATLLIGVLISTLGLIICIFNIEKPSKSYALNNRR